MFKLLVWVCVCWGTCVLLLWISYFTQSLSNQKRHLRREMDGCPNRRHPEHQTQSKGTLTQLDVSAFINSVSIMLGSCLDMNSFLFLEKMLLLVGQLR